MTNATTAPLPPMRPLAASRSRRHEFKIVVSPTTLAMIDGIARASHLTRHAVFAIAVRVGAGSITNLSPSELWAMLPRNTRSRMSKSGVIPADRYALRERLRQRKIANVHQE